MVWLPAVAALVVLAPTRLPAALGRLPSVRRVGAKTCLAAKTLPASPKLTAPRRSSSEPRKALSNARRSSSAVISSVFSVMRASILSIGIRLAAMMSVTMP